MLKLELVQTDKHSTKILLRRKNLRFLRRTNLNTNTLPTIMKKSVMKINLTLSILFFLSFITTYSQNEKEVFEYLEWCPNIQFIHINDNCGEWGGDKEIINIYKVECRGKILADYEKITRNCSEDEDKQRENKIEKVYIELTIDEKKLVNECIEELIRAKLTNRTFITHSGIHNSIIFKDSTFIIKDYPSINWKTFENLKERLLNK